MPTTEGPSRLTPVELPARTPPRRRIGSPGLGALPVQRDEEKDRGGESGGEKVGVVRGGSEAKVKDSNTLQILEPIGAAELPLPEGEGRGEGLRSRPRKPSSSRAYRAGPSFSLREKEQVGDRREPAIKRSMARCDPCLVLVRHHRHARSP